MPVSCHFRDCKSAAGHESDSCKRRYNNALTFTFKTHIFDLVHIRFALYHRLWSSDLWRIEIFILLFFVFLMQFGLRRAAPFVSSPEHLLFVCRRRVSNTTSRASGHIGERSSAGARRCDQCAYRPDDTTTHAVSRQLGWCTVDSGFSHNNESFSRKDGLLFHRLSVVSFRNRYCFVGLWKRTRINPLLIF